MSAMERARRLRRARREHAEAIAEIYAEAVTRGGATLDTQAVPAHSFALACEDRQIELFVSLARGAECVAGWGRIQPWSHKGGYAHTFEVSIFVAEAHWRRGHAKGLLEHAIATARAGGGRHLVARIFASNSASLTLFEDCFGFERVGTQREIGWQHGAWVDIVILQLLLG